MINRRFVIIASIFTISILIIAYLYISRWGLDSTEWDSPDNTFTIRLLADTGKGEYRFQSSLAGSMRWVDFLSFNLKDEITIPTPRAHFVNEDVAYVYMDAKYSVTVDGGKRWSVWEGWKQLPAYDRSRAASINIQDVTMEAGGMGKMSVEVSGLQNSEIELRTKDYGHHWEIWHEPVTVEPKL